MNSIKINQRKPRYKLCLHVRPVYPGGHRHVYELTSSMHVALLEHVDDKQSSMSANKNTLDIVYM